MKYLLFFFTFFAFNTWSHDEYYKFDAPNYEKMMFHNLDKEHAKKYLDKYKANKLLVRNIKKPYSGKIIDGHAHPRKKNKKSLKAGTKYFMYDMPKLVEDAKVDFTLIMVTPNTYSSKSKFNYYYEFADKNKNIKTLCHSNFVGMANDTTYSKKDILNEYKQTITKFKNGLCYGVGEVGPIHYNKKKKDPPNYDGWQRPVDIDLEHWALNLAFKFAHDNNMPIVLHVEPFYEIKKINRISEVKKFYKKKCKQYPKAKLVASHTGMMPPKDLEELFKHCNNLYSDWKIAFHWSSLWGFEDLHIPNDYRFKLHEIWAQSFEKFPDRYYFGSDHKLGKSPAHDHYAIHYMKHVRLMIGSLNSETQSKIAYKNAAKLFKVNID